MVDKIRNNHPDISPANGAGVRAIRAGDTIYVSGCTALNTPEQAADVITQARVTLDKIKRIIAAHGGKPSDIVRMAIFVVDMPAFMSRYQEFNQLMEDLFQDGAYPTSTIVGTTGLAIATMNIEIEVTAVL